MELRGFEPLTFCMPCIPVSSDHIALGPIAAGESGFNVWGRLAQSGEIWLRWSLAWSWFAGPPCQGRPGHRSPWRSAQAASGDHLKPLSLLLVLIVQT